MIFWRSDLQSWLSFNGRMMSNICATQPPWKVVFPITIWNVWKSRNNMVFNKKKRNPSLAMEIVKQALEHYHCVASPRLQTRKVLKGIWWERPPQGWMKLNNDGSANGNPGLAGCGGVIRDDSGQWIVGFSKCIGITNSFAAKLWGLREGLILCCNLNVSSLEIELDAKAIADILNKPNYVNNIISPILDDYRL